MPSPLNPFVAGSAGSQAAASVGGGSIEQLERTGRRLTMLQQFAPELVNSSPEGALELAENGGDDDEMLRSAVESENFASIQRLRESLEEESDDVQRATWGSLPEPIAEAMRDMGYSPPERREGGRLFGSIPIVGDVAEAALDWGEIPGVGGALEEAQHFAGEGLQGVQDAADPVLGAMAWPQEQIGHVYRAWVNIQEESPGGASLSDYFSPSQLSRAWSETDRDDGYVRPGQRNRARNMLGGDQTLYDIAHGMAVGKSPEEIIEDAGFEPDSPEGTRLGLQIVQVQGEPDFQDAVHELSVGQVSFGRTVANSVGLEDTDNGWGRWVSGLADAGFNVASDPLLRLGSATRTLRFGRHAFRLENGGDLSRLHRVTDLAIDGVRGREGLEGVAQLGNVRPWEMRRARQVTNWADRVSEGFRSGDLATLMRDLPNTGTALNTMHRAHLRRVANGERGLDDPLGALEWLKDRDGTLGLVGTRLGGASPMTQGIRLPALTNSQRATLYAKGQMQRAIDWSRGLEAPQVREIVGALGSPRDLVRQLGQFGLAHTVGDTGRVLTTLTSHVPYSNVLPLYGNQSIEEFSRLVNTGIFAGMSRSTMDDYINGFAQGDLVARSNMVEQYLGELFRRTGIGDTDFAQRFVGRHRQAYANDAADLVGNGTIESRSARLVDAQHADALAIPSTREFLRETARTNLTRFLFNNTPASYADAALGRVWKPSVLMRLGFIPRAAGEELLHFALKHGARTWMGAKGAEWQVRGEVTPFLEARLREAEDLGRVDEVNRLTQELASVRGSSLTAPFRSLAGAGDRMLTRLLSTDAVEHAGWRNRWIEKANALDERGVVSGLEQLAANLSLHASGVIERIARMTHMPSKQELGRIMSERWNPGAAEAARLLLEDPRVARAYAEQISGSTMTPWEFRGVTDANGAPVPKVEISDRAFGRPAVREVPLRPRSGEWGMHSLGGTHTDGNSYYSSIYSRHHRLANDRVASRVVENALPRWVGPWGDGLARRLGYNDVGSLRADLNQLWSYASEGEDAVQGSQLLDTARRIADKDDEAGEGLRVWLGQEVDRISGELGLNLDGRRFRELLDDDTADSAAQRWTLYQNVDENRLIDNWPALENQVRHTARGRLARPDMQRRLREMRLYSDERLALPTADGISKVYVPLVSQQVDVLGDDFVEAATRRIRMIGGYSEERAQQIARNVQYGVQRGRDAVPDMGGRIPLSAWGASDPRVADAVMGAADEITGARTTFGVLEVPDEVIQTSVGDRAMGLRSRAEHWQVADDYEIDPWRLIHTQPTAQQRRISQLDIDGEWWEDVELDAATTAYRTARPGTTRRYSTDHETWTDQVPEGPFWYLDLPEDVAARYGDNIPDEVVDEHRARRLPGVPDETGSWHVRHREVGDGLGEIEALERVANSSTDEIFELLTTLKRQELDNDVLHEVVEPMLRGDMRYVDEAGNEVIRRGYGYDHLIGGVSADRLPRETYGPHMVGQRDLTWDRIVGEWFQGPVDQALSSVIRSPMFLNNFGEQLRNSRAIADLFVDDDIAEAVRASGLAQEQLDNLALALKHGDGDEAILDAYRTVSGQADATLEANDLQALRRYAQQRNHGLDLVRTNSLNRAVQLTVPFIDDHRIRSAFQQYVGNFVPFQFAEEQFLKRWARSVFESPEMIRKAQLAMNGLRSMGTVRRDGQGNEVFVYPLVGEAVSVLSKPLSWVFGEQLRVPYVGAMTGRVDYALPGLGDQMGVPSVGPLISMPLEYLSRHFPELAEVEQHISGPGADRPLWSYFVPSWAGRVYESVRGDIDKGQLASATTQAIQTMAVNGQIPDENATAAEKEEFISRVEGQARIILLARGLFGMMSPAAPQWSTEADQLSDEFKSYLRTGGDFEAAVQAFLGAHPDAEPADILAATVFETEAEYAGPSNPTDQTFDFIQSNSDLLAGFPAAAPWLLPHGDANDEFSHRAWAQQTARGMRKRKTAEEFLNDIYFRGASRDYFEAKTIHDASMLTAKGQARADLTEQWNAWKGAYFRQHPAFAQMLEDPTRRQRRQQAIDELVTLSASDDGIVPDELRELVNGFNELRLSVTGLRGDRRQMVANHRRDLVDEFVTRAQWQIQANPHLSGFYLQILEPLLRELDEDAVLRGAA